MEPNHAASRGKRPRDGTAQPTSETLGRQSAANKRSGRIHGEALPVLKTSSAIPAAAVSQSPLSMLSRHAAPLSKPNLTETEVPNREWLHDQFQSLLDQSLWKTQSSKLPDKLPELLEAQKEASSASLERKQQILDSASEHYEKYSTLDEQVAFWKLYEACMPCKSSLRIHKESFYRIGDVLIEDPFGENLEKVFDILHSLTSLSISHHLSIHSADECTEAETSGARILNLAECFRYGMCYDDIGDVRKHGDEFSIAVQHLYFLYMETFFKLDLYSLINAMNEREEESFKGYGSGIYQDFPSFIISCDFTFSRLLACGRFQDSHRANIEERNKILALLFRQGEMATFDQTYGLQTDAYPKALDDLYKAVSYFLDESYSEPLPVNIKRLARDFLEKNQDVLNQEKYTPLKNLIEANAQR